MPKKQRAPLSQWGSSYLGSGGSTSNHWQGGNGNGSQTGWQNDASRVRQHHDLRHRAVPVKNDMTVSCCVSLMICARAWQQAKQQHGAEQLSVSRAADLLLSRVSSAVGTPRERIYTEKLVTISPTSECIQLFQRFGTVTLGISRLHLFPARRRVHNSILKFWLF